MTTRRGFSTFSENILQSNRTTRSLCQPLILTRALHLAICKADAGSRVVAARGGARSSDFPEEVKHCTGAGSGVIMVIATHQLLSGHHKPVLISSLSHMHNMHNGESKIYSLNGEMGCRSVRGPCQAHAKDPLLGLIEAIRNVFTTSLH